MIAYFDIFSGISGDMTLGAFLDLGVPVDWLEEKLSRVVQGFRLDVKTVYPQHLRATDVTVAMTGEAGAQGEISRNYTDIRDMIEKSALPEPVKQNSLTAFKKIARAESVIHGKDIETVHFHEIGGIDSIVDIIGSFLCVLYLGIDEVVASPIPLGSGFVTCAHGKIPVPVPATLAILKDTPVTSSDATTEIVTPTGAAIITTLATKFGRMPGMTVGRTGYGSGKRDTGGSVPNLLRIVLGEWPGENNPEHSTVREETIWVAKTNVDDMNPEILGFLMETLLEKGALDVCFHPVHMKKNRPGTQVEVILRKNQLEEVVHTILSETSATGVRYHELKRSFLFREKAFVETSFGKLQVKKIVGPDHKTRFVPEYEAAKQVALEKKIPLKEVYRQILTRGNSLDRE